MVCPPKQGPLAESSGWNKLVKDIKEKFGLDDARALKLAEIAFYKKGDMPSSEEAISILSNKGKDYTKTALKEKMKDFAAGLKTGMDKGFLAGQMRQGRSMDEDIRVLEQQVASGEITQKDLEARVKELKYEVGYKEAEARLAGEISGKTSGRKEGVDKQRAFQKEFAARVKDYLKTNESFRGKISEKQMDAIVNKAAKIGTSERAYAKFTDYVDKVIEKENYAEDLNEGTSLRKKIKRSFADSDDFVKRMKGLDIEKLSPEELIEFNQLSKDYIDSTKPITSEGYTPFEKEQNVLKLEVLEKAVSDKIIKETEDAYGVLGLNKEEADLMNEFMSAENQDLFEYNLSEAKQKQLRYNLERVSDYSLLGLKESLAANKEAMTESLGKTTVDQLEDISKVDVSIITDKKDLADITRTINNNIINGTNSNVGKVHTTVKAYENEIKLKKIADGILIPVIGSGRKIYYDTPILFKALFGNRKVAAAFRYLTGYDGVVTSSSKSETKTINKKKLWDKFKKENNISNSAEEDIQIGIYSRLNDVEKGNENESFLNEKEQLKESINRALKSEDADTVQVGNFLNNTYKEIVEGANTHEDFVNKYKQAFLKAVEASEWISNNIWKENMADFKNHAESNLNETFDGELRDSYHAKSYYSIDGKTDVIEPGADAFDLKTGKPKETGRSRARTLKDKLPDGKIVDYRFEYNTFKSYQDVLFEIGSFHDAGIMYKISKLPGFDGILGGKKNADFFIKTYNTQYDLLKNGKKNLDEINRSIIASTARSLRNIGSAIGLGRASQFISQTTPAVSALVQNRKYFVDVVKTKGVNNVELLNLRQIGARGLELGAAGRSEGVETLAYNKITDTKRALLRFVTEKTGRAREISLTPLTYADITVAKKTFLSFYLKYMNEAGVNVTAKDLATEHLRLNETREKALSYAQQATDEMQGVSSRAMLSEFKRNDSGDWLAQATKNAILPFNNFASNTRARLTEDIIKIRYGNKQQKSEAAKDLTGTLAESVVYSAVNAFLVTGAIRYGLKQVIAPIFGLSDEDNFSEYMSKKLKVFYTGIMREIFVSGYGSAVETSGVELMNWFAYNISKLDSDGDNQKYYEWLKSEATFKPSYEAPSPDVVAKIANTIGGYGIPISAGREALFTLKSGITGVGRSEFEYSKATEKGEGATMDETMLLIQKKKGFELTDEERNFHLFLGLMQGLSILGLGERDIMNASRSIKNDISKMPPKSSGGQLGGKSFSKGFKKGKPL